MKSKQNATGKMSLLGAMDTRGLSSSSLTYLTGGGTGTILGKLGQMVHMDGDQEWVRPVSSRSRLSLFLTAYRMGLCPFYRQEPKLRGEM